MEIKLNLRKCVVVRGRGPDKIYLAFEGPPCYVYSDYDESPSLVIDTSEGFAEEWLHKTFGIAPEFIEVVTVPSAF